MADPFLAHEETLITPARAFKMITPHDTNEIDPLPKAFETLVDGDVTIVDGDGNVAVVHCLAGIPKSLRPKVIKATGTAAGITTVCVYLR